MILASGSPRRLELLRNLGLSFEVVVSRVDETVPAGIAPDKLVKSLALAKAEAVLTTLSGNQELVLIGADTMVVLDGELIGKPSDGEDARRMLIKLSNRTHEVLTGVAVLRQTKEGDVDTLVCLEKSLVTFRSLSEAEIAAYVTTGEPLDKAGSYALQGIGAAFVAKIDGCYTNIIGLPIPKLVGVLRSSGLAILGEPDCTQIT